MFFAARAREQLWGLFNPNFLYMRLPEISCRGANSASFKMIRVLLLLVYIFFTRPKSRRRLFDFCQAWKIEKKSARTGRFYYSSVYLWPLQFLINLPGKSQRRVRVERKKMENGAVRNDSVGIHHLIRVGIYKNILRRWLLNVN
jgi:hypothetical protein